MTDDDTLAVVRKHLRVQGVAPDNQRLTEAIAGAFAELHPEVTMLAEATVLRLEPGDIIVLTVQHPVSDKQVDDLTRQMRDQFPDHRAVLFDNGLQLAVLRPTNGEAPPGPPDYEG